MAGAKSARTALIDIMRKNASRIFAIRSVTDIEMYAKSYDRSTDPVFANLLKSPKNPDETYAMYPHVLFKNYEVNNRGLFGSIAILNVSLSHLSKSHPSSQRLADIEGSPLRANHHWLQY